MQELRRHPIVLVDATADASRVYQYRSDRLWFVHRDGHLFATLASCPDNALSDVQFAIPAEELDLGQQPMGISRDPDHEDKRRDELREWARQHGVVVPFRFLYPNRFQPRPKSPLLLALKSAERFVKDALAEAMALHQLAAQDGHDDLYRGTLDNATETLRIIQAAIVKGETE